MIDRQKAAVYNPIILYQVSDIRVLLELVTINYWQFSSIGYFLYIMIYWCIKSVASTCIYFMISFDTFRKIFEIINPFSLQCAQKGTKHQKQLAYILYYNIVFTFSSNYKIIHLLENTAETKSL